MSVHMGPFLRLSSLLPVLPAFHTGVLHKTTSPLLYYRADMPQSEKDGEKRRGDKEEEWQPKIRKKKRTGRVRKNVVVAVGCSFQRQLE